jgi:glycopeptide antibiotics resistance protein
MSESHPRRALLDTLLVLAAAGILAVTIPPTGANNHTFVHPIPFQEIVPAIRGSTPEFTLAAVIGNLFLFVPLGVLLPIRFPRLDRLSRTAGVCAAISASIELLQLPIGHHSTSTDDVILNTAGGILGFVAMRARRAVLRGRGSRKRAGTTRPPG